MTQDIGAPRRILAVVDHGEGQIALRSAAALAERHGAALDVLCCVEPPHDLNIVARFSGRDPEELIRALTARERDRVASGLREVLPDRGIEPHVVVGKAFLEIIRFVSRMGSDFVVKSAEPLPGGARFLFASTDQHLLRKCPSPVWLQTRSAPVAPRRVLAAIDLDAWDAEEPETLMALNRRVVEVASTIADPSEAEVTVLHAWEALDEGTVWAFSAGTEARISADRYVNEVLESRRAAMRSFLTSVRGSDASGPRLTPLLVRGSPERVIEERSRLLDADVVVMGTVARTGLAGVFIGNTAENIINTLGRPVLAVKPDGFVSPLV